MADPARADELAALDAGDGPGVAGQHGQAQVGAEPLGHRADVCPAGAAVAGQGDPGSAGHRAGMVVLHHHHLGMAGEDPAELLDAGRGGHGPGRVLGPQGGHERPAAGGQRAGEPVGQRAVVVHRHRLGSQPQGPDQVEGRREPGVVDGHPVPGAQVGLEDALDPVEGPADHGQPGHRHAVGLELGGGQGGQLGQDRVLAIEMVAAVDLGEGRVQRWQQCRVGPPVGEVAHARREQGRQPTDRQWRPAGDGRPPAAPGRDHAPGPQPPVGGGHRGRADPEPEAELADGGEPVARPEPGLADGALDAVGDLGRGRPGDEVQLRLAHPRKHRKQRPERTEAMSRGVRFAN